MISNRCKYCSLIVNMKTENTVVPCCDYRQMLSVATEGKILNTYRIQVSKLTSPWEHSGGVWFLDNFVQNLESLVPPQSNYIE